MREKGIDGRHAEAERLGLGNQPGTAPFVNANAFIGPDLVRLRCLHGICTISLAYLSPRQPPLPRKYAMIDAVHGDLVSQDSGAPVTRK